MNDCFVTGGSGFVGYHLVKLLRSRGYRVRCLVRANSNRKRLEPLGVEFVEGDLSSADFLKTAMDGADTVFHLAGLVQARKTEEFFEVNQHGCRRMAEAACAMKNPPRVVSVSSLAAAGATRKNSPAQRKATGQKYTPRTETTPVRPISWYGRSKLAGERELIRFSEQLPITVLRPPIVFGPGDLHSLSLFTMVLRSSLFLLPGFWDYPYSFIYVKDLAMIMLLAAERGETLTPRSISERANSDGSFDCTGEGIYLPAHPEAPYFSEFGHMIGKAVDKPNVHSIFCPPMGVWGTGLFQEMVKQVTRRRVSFDLEKAKESLGGPWYCSGQKVRENLCMSFDRTLQEQVIETAVWYRENGWFKKMRKWE